MKPIKKLKGKSVAIVGLGKSWHDYNLAKSHGAHFDEVWAINAVGSVIFHDRTFMMDPVSRFLDSDDAGGQTSGMTDVLLNDDKPIYTCELDSRCKNLVEYPLNEVLQAFNCHYLNNTVAYAIAFALWNEVGTIKMFGIDFSYKGNLHFAESGRACVEFWLSKGMVMGTKIEVAKTSGLLDTDVPAEEKLYGYHRLDDPKVVLSDGQGTMLAVNVSELPQEEQKDPEPVLIDRNDGHLKTPEPKKMVDKLTPSGLPELGVVEIATTNYGGHPPEFWAKQLTDKIVGYSDNNEQHIKDQARAYKDLIYEVSLIYIKNAIKSYKASLIQELTQGDAQDLAKIIKGI